MRGWSAIAIAAAACGGTKAPPAKAPEAVAPAPAAAAAPAAARVCDPSSIQPMLDANARLAHQWGDGLDGVPLDHVALVPAHDDLEAAPGGEPVLILGPDGYRWHGTPRGAPAVVLAIDANTLWSDVVSELHDLGGEVTVRFAFAVDEHDARLADNPLRAGFDAAKARALGADFAKRCPQVGDLFLGHDDQLAYIAKEAQRALGSCACAVTPTELAQAYDVLFVLDYVAVRSVSYSPQGVVVSARRRTPFARVAPMIMAARHGAPLSFQVE